MRRLFLIGCIILINFNASSRQYRDTIVTEKSTDFINWTPVSTNVVTSTNIQSSYRIRLNVLPASYAQTLQALESGNVLYYENFFPGSSDNNSYAPINITCSKNQQLTGYLFVNPQLLFNPITDTLPFSQYEICVFINGFESTKNVCSFMVSSAYQGQYFALRLSPDDIIRTCDSSGQDLRFPMLGEPVIKNFIFYLP